MRSVRFTTAVLVLIALVPSLLAKSRSSVANVSHAQSVTGVVHAVNGALISILDGNVTIDASGAKIVSGREEASLADVKPGARIHAVLDLTNPATQDGALRAHIVAVDNPPDGNLTGSVQSVDVAGNRFSVLGETVLVTPQTLFVGSATHPDGALALSNVKAGDPISVDVDVSAAGLTAIRVMILHLTPRPGVQFSGIVQSIGAEQWVITDASGKEVAVKITPDTKIGGSPAVGDRVEVFGHYDSANQFVAISIVKAVPRPAMFRGFVRSIAPTEWTIVDPSKNAITLRVTADTKIVGSPIVGDLVEVVATIDPHGSYVALSIAKATVPPIPTVINGTVKSIGAHEWTLIDAKGETITVRVTADTRIDRSIAVGDHVGAAVTRDAAGVLTAISIMKLVTTPPPTDLVKFEGVVRNIEGEIWTVDTTKVVTGARTLFIGHPHVGDKVRVVGVKSFDGSVNALSIEKL